jgi:exonuclease 3'-5' domain-containing protein 1
MFARICPSSTAMEPRPLLCDTEAILTAALPILQGCSTLILDCEGLRLGECGGSLSLVTLRTTTPSPIRTYIIDTVKLPRAALQPVFDILCSSNVCKVLFDGRMDYSAFYHGYGIELTNIVDVQLVDVASRPARGKGQADQFRRLQRYLPYIDFQANKEAYQQVNKLSGLNECVEEHNAITSTANLKGSGTIFRLLIVVYLSKYLFDY